MKFGGQALAVPNDVDRGGRLAEIRDFTLNEILPTWT
jgi:hypothetical protein